MKITVTKAGFAAMSRVKVLALICVAVVAAYVAGRYQQTGELIFLKWVRKAPDDSTVKPLQSPIEKVVEDVDATEASTVGPDTTRSVSVSPQHHKNSVSEPASYSATTELRLEDWQKKKVMVPTNAVWSQTQPRKSPGIRIAFP